jgi:hypothetical protein
MWRKTSGDRPAVLGLERNDFENQQVQGALHQIGGLAHLLTSVTDTSSTDNSNAEALRGSRGEWFDR